MDFGRSAQLVARLGSLGLGGSATLATGLLAVVPLTERLEVLVAVVVTGVPVVDLVGWLETELTARLPPLALGAVPAKDPLPDLGPVGR